MTAYVLHSRPYKETSALVDFFTPAGVLRAVLRGARGKAGSIARPFAELELSLRGRGELKNVAALEALSPALWLQGHALYSGLYLNELLLRLLPAEEPQPELFDHYALTVQGLAAGRPLEPLLRVFEWRLLEQLGYGFALDVDGQGRALEPLAWYRWQAGAGLQPVSELQPGLFRGADLLALQGADWNAPGTLNTAKRLMRQALAPHLGGRPLASRELFITPKEPVRE